MLRLAKTFELLTAALNRLGIPYAVVGSVASSARGAYRATEDIDVLANISPEQASRLAETLGKDWYVDEWQIRGAIAAGRAFNLIYIPFGQKVDVFPLKDDFGAAQLQHATKLPVPALGEGVEYPVISAEDVVLAKLASYQAGGGTSERQWSDILGVIRVTAELDWRYLQAWAMRLDVESLLKRARGESE